MRFHEDSDFGLVDLLQIGYDYFHDFLSAKQVESIYLGMIMFLIMMRGKTNII